MKKISTLLLVFYTCAGFSQDFRNLSYSWDQFENLEAGYKMPKLLKNQKLTRYRYTLVGQDTTSQVVDYEVYSYEDRFVELVYEEESGILEEKETLFFIDSNRTLTVFEYTGEDGPEIDSTFKTYRNNLLEICDTYSYEFDTLNNYAKSVNFYDQQQRISSVEQYSKGKLVRQSRYIYHPRGFIDRVEQRDTFGVLTSFVSYFRNKWVNDKLYEVVRYRADSTLSRRTIVPGNPRYPDNLCIIKSYSPPRVDAYASLTTTEMEKVVLDTEEASYQIKIRRYSDQNFAGETIKTYDHQNRIIREENFASPNSIVYRYVLTQIEE